MGILNDEERIVHFYIDREFLDEPALLGIHPNDNTATVWIRTADLIGIVKEHGNPADITELPDGRQRMGKTGCWLPFTLLKMETEEPQGLCQDIFLIIMVMDLMGQALWKNTLHMIRTSITHRFKWDCRLYITLAGRIRRIRKSGSITS